MPKATPSTARPAHTVTPHEALIYVMIMASAVDRVMSDIEMEAIGSIVRRLPAFEGFDKKRLLQVAKHCAEALARPDGFDATLGMIEKTLPKDLHLTAYAFAVEIAAVDKTVNLEEVRLLEILAEKLDLTDLETAAIKQSAEARYRAL